MSSPGLLHQVAATNKGLESRFGQKALRPPAQAWILQQEEGVQVLPPIPSLPCGGCPGLHPNCPEACRVPAEGTAALRGRLGLTSRRGSIVLLQHDSDPAGRSSGQGALGGPGPVELPGCIPMQCAAGPSTRLLLGPRPHVRAGPLSAPSIIQQTTHVIAPSGE